MAGPGKNYTLGRGKLYFARYLSGTQEPQGELYIGNTPEFNATIEAENLDHYSSDEGVREKDESIPLQTNRSAGFSTDNIDANNLANFFFGEVQAFATVAGTFTDEPHLVQGGRFYQLGRTAQNPVGARELDIHTPAVNPDPAKKIVVMGTGASSGTEFVEGTDYTIDMKRGRLYIVPGGAIDVAAKLLPAGVLPITVDYKTKVSTRNRIISGSKPIEGALHYVADNPVGENYDWYMPYVKLSPNGEYQLKGDDWQVIPFSVEILKLSGYEALYIDGEAYTA